MTILTILAALIILHSLLSHRLERTLLTGPMIFTVAETPGCFALPEQTSAIVDLKPVLRLAEITLAVMLFDVHIVPPGHAVPGLSYYESRSTLLRIAGSMRWSYNDR
jgi:hypothetical protein